MWKDGCERRMWRFAIWVTGWNWGKKVESVLRNDDVFGVGMLGQCSPVLDIAKTHSGKLPIKLNYRLKQYKLFVIWILLVKYLYLHEEDISIWRWMRSNGICCFIGIRIIFKKKKKQLKPINIPCIKKKSFSFCRLVALTISLFLNKEPICQIKEVFLLLPEDLTWHSLQYI